MSATAFSDRAHAKVNLTLRVVGRRTDGYHELESLVVFADLADTLSFEPGEGASLDVSGPFARASGATSDNLVLKASAVLSQLVPGLKTGRFHLEKNIPAAAGIGGGSADAAAALRLLARANGISFDDVRLMTAALKVGADVPVCFGSQACVMAGIGERLSPPLALPAVHAVLVNPGVAVPTKDVFKAYAALEPVAHERLGDVPLSPEGLFAFLESHGNDLIEPAIRCAPVIGEVLETLRGLPGVRVARMSGSGATCFALFETASAAEAAHENLKATGRAWWSCVTKLG